MTGSEQPSDSGGTAWSAEQSEPNEHLRDVVDGMEDKVIEERKASGVPGNAAEREEATPVDSGDDAPD
ncbi:hypothetical protein FOS14_14775 [Skermania sp. ID1734]|uniref:hypothetical protein n=1 Tax=Skermania sp. ID1734 TaxID=2597516 RepID=UPI001180FCFF|nr:hypothetical protein [Skermania sp. ID1734]TSD97249.1 hypothetical protein FOS14_14775 [Skermania sp. ID1734]